MSGESVNRLIRAAAGYGPPPAPERELERPVGDIGGGKGGCCAMPRPQATSSSAMNDRIRAGVALTRAAALAGGVHIHDAVDVDDLLGR